MDQPTHTIDPDGEVIIILRNANAPFAEFDEDTVTNIIAQTTSEPSNYVQNQTNGIATSENRLRKPGKTSKKGKKKRSAARSIPHPTSLDDVPQFPEEPVEAPVEASSEEPVEEMPAEPFFEELADTGLIGGTSDSERLRTYDGLIKENSNYKHCASEQYNSGEDLIERSVRIQVSAKHLTLASSVFKKLLTSSWKESVTYLQKGSVEITTESWDLEAFLILLRIMHCQHYNIPRKLTLKMLAKVALLADYYKCKEAVRFSQIHGSRL